MLRVSLLVALLAACGSSRDATPAGQGGTSGSNAAGSGSATGGSTTAPTSSDAAPRAASLVPAQLAECTTDRWCTLPGVVPGGRLYAFARESDDRFWAVGERGLVLHWTGSAFEHWRLGPGYLKAVKSDGTDTWVLGVDTVARYRGGEWKHFKLAPYLANIDGVAVRDGQAWIVAWRLRPPDDAPETPTGATLFHVGTDDTITSHVMPIEASDVWAAAPDDIWIAGTLGKGVYRWNGKRWRSTNLPRAKHDTGFASRIDGTGSDNVWVMSDWSVFHWNGKAWREVPDARHAHGLQVRAADDVIINDTTSHYRWNGSAWSHAPGRALALDASTTLIETDELRLHGASGPKTLQRGAGIVARAAWAGPDAVYVAGVMPDGKRAALARWDGERWHREAPPGPRLVDIDGIDSPWLLHSNGLLSRKVAGAWKSGQTLVRKPFALVVTGPDTAWVAGDDVLSRRTEVAWTKVAAPAARIYAIAAAPSGTVFVIAGDTSDARSLYRWDGAVFVKLADVAPDARRLAATADDAVVIGGYRELWRWTPAGVVSVGWGDSLVELRRFGTEVYVVSTGAKQEIALVPSSGDLSWQQLPIAVERLTGRDGVLWGMQVPEGELAVRPR